MDSEENQHLQRHNHLVLREAICGALQAKDTEGVGKIHTSDFRATLERMHLPFGHDAVANILVHCTIDDEGMVDFSNLAGELRREREVVASRMRSEPKGGPTSQGTPQTPWRPNEFHRQEVEAEEQGRNVHAKHEQIRKIYAEYIQGSMSNDTFVQRLNNIGINATTNLTTLLRQSEACDMTFKDLIRALTSSNSGVAGSERDTPAGGASNLWQRIDDRPDDGTAGMMYSRRRTDWTKNRALYERSEERDLIPRKSGARSRQGSFYTDSNSMQNVMRTTEDAAPPTTETRRQWHSGVGLAETSSTNSEQKLIREQVLAALQQLNQGNLTRVHFLQKMHSMGVDVPENLLSMLSSYEASGSIDFRAAVREFERFLEIKRMDKQVDPERIRHIKQRVRETLQARGADSMQALAQVFRDMDANDDHGLSFNEFKAGIDSFGLNLSTDDIRVLFNDYDEDGNGELSYEEFLTGIRGRLRGDRLELVRHCYQILDVTGEGNIPVTELRDKFNPTHDPDVVAGRKSRRQALVDMVAAFQDAENGLVSLEKFEEYYANLSVNIHADEDFTNMLRNCWGMPEQPPPPPHFVRLADGRVKTTPLAQQSHGDILGWHQQASALEQRQLADDRKRVEAKHERRTFSVNGWDNVPVTEEERGRPARATGAAAPQIESEDNIIQWDGHGQGIKPSHIPQGRRTRAAPRGIDDRTEIAHPFVVAGKKKTTAGAWQQNFQGGCPFGVDEAALKQQAERANKPSGPKALSDLVGTSS